MKPKVSYIIISLLVIAVLLVSAIGCGDSDKEPTSENSTTGNVSGEEVTTENVSLLIQNAMLNIETYQCDIEMSMSLDGVLDNEPGHITMSAEANMVYDSVDKEMEMYMDMSIEGEEDGETIDETMTVSLYVVDNLIYMGTTDLSGETYWLSEELPAYLWDEQDQMKQLTQMLEQSEVKDLNSEKVNGVECYVIDIEIDLNTLMETMMAQSQMGDFFEEMPMFDSDSMKEMALKYWTAKDTLYPLKEYVYFNIDMNAEDFGEEGEGEITMVMEMTVYFDKFNEDVDIVVPDEALENAW